jgi:putative flippase GtrA
MTDLDLTTTSESPSQQQPASPTRTCDVDIVVPVFNEAVGLETSIRQLHAFLCTDFPLRWRITIVDNASSDTTWPLACGLTRELAGVHATRLAQKVDLSTDLAALLPLVAPLLSGHSDLAIGTRLASGSRVVRGPKREVISRCYNTLLRLALGARFSDAQCGFKAIRRDQASALLSTVVDQDWFFDTELLVRAQRRGLRIHEVPVDWVDDPDSRVDILTTVRDDLRGVARLLGERITGRFGRQVASFIAVGVASTLAYLALYLSLRTAVPAVAANAISLAVTTVANTAANRRYTFGIRDRHDRFRQQLQGLGVFATALTITTAAVTLLRYADPGASRTVEAIVLVLANLGATVLRFLLLRGWVFAASTAAIPTLEGQS